MFRSPISAILSRSTFLSTALALSVVAAVAFASSACSSAAGASTGSTCDSSLTYANFGKAFFDENCLSCHGGRQGPSLSTVEAIRTNKGAIDRAAAAGPDSTNTAMPQGGSVSLDDRKKLGAWLACGAP